ncbi:hypothetical protein [Flavobacterium sp.]|uniref:hypothetical protein n=1 Tax=Flavobacterium sp. TaxID=239 RepID=UPI00375013E9
MNDYKVYEGQTLYDVCAHVYGHIDSVMEISIINGISPTDVLVTGQAIKLIDSKPNTLVKKVLENRNIIPATELNEEQKQNLPPNFGIGKMAIGSTFIIR